MRTYLSSISGFGLPGASPISSAGPAVARLLRPANASTPAAPELAAAAASAAGAPWAVQTNPSLFEALNSIIGRARVAAAAAGAAPAGYPANQARGRAATRGVRRPAPSLDPAGDT